MKLASVLIALALTIPAGAATDKPKDKKKPAESSSAGSVVREAEAKAAAGDSDGAVELLRRAAAAPGASGEIALRLGRFHEQRFEVDLAIDAYAAAATALLAASGIPRISWATESRPSASARAAPARAVAAAA